MPPKLVIVAVLALSGCATSNQTISAAPNATYESAKSPDVATQCLSERLGFLAGGPSIVRETHETRITFDTGSYAYLVISIRPDTTGSRISVHHRLSYPQRIRQAVESCV